jgi:hypothetical protein
MQGSVGVISAGKWNSCHLAITATIAVPHIMYTNTDRELRICLIQWYTAKAFITAYYVAVNSE